MSWMWLVNFLIVLGALLLAAHCFVAAKPWRLASIYVAAGILIHVLDISLAIFTNECTVDAYWLSWEFVQKLNICLVVDEWNNRFIWVGQSMLIGGLVGYIVLYMNRMEEKITGQVSSNDNSGQH